MQRNPERLSSQTFDLLVCGGGVYGAWIAWDAALRGLSVALIDQGDWASATSSASSKLIHGGLRYLENFQFGMVTKALMERQRLLSLAPHRVWPLRFSIPVYATGRLSRVRLAIGLSIYHRLAAKQAMMKPKYWSKTAFVARWSMLKSQDLLGGFSYGDAQTDDARLVLELVAGACNAGAVCVNYCQLLQYQYQQQRLCGALLLDRQTGCEQVIAASCVVNAMGRWQRNELPDACRLSKGVHLVLPDMQLPEALLLTAQSDGRVFFVMPWYGRTLLGTTDQDFTASLDQLRVELHDVLYLLNALNDYSSKQFVMADVIGVFVGLRVMRASVAQVAQVSRDWEFKLDENGVFYSLGGKITSARQDAAHAVDRLCAWLGRSLSVATKSCALCWAPEQEWGGWQQQQMLRGQQLGVDSESLCHLLARFGRRIDEVFVVLQQQPDWAQRIVSEVPLIYADLYCCAQHEMVVHLDDLLRRRMPLLILARLSENFLLQLAQFVAPLLAWDAAQIQEECARCVDHYAWEKSL